MEPGPINRHEGEQNMNLSTLTNKNLVVLNSDLNTKESIIEALITKLYEDGKITSKEAFQKAVYYRESLTPTGIDQGLAIPHGKDASVKEASFAVMTLKNPVNGWESVVEGNKVKYVFLLAIPEKDEEGTQMQLLAEMMKKMSNEAYTNALYKSTTVEEFIRKLDRDTEANVTKKYDKSIVAVTACAAGIAHTYMAAEALIKAGEEMGVSVYVEKQGANGIEARHTNEMLKNADAAIFAVDVAVKEESRFAHLPTVKTKVSAPLKDAKGIIKQALDKASQTKKGEYVETMETRDEGFVQTVKASVLTGISHVVPLIVAGGMISALCTIFARMFGMVDVLSTEGTWLYLIKNMGGGLLGTLMVPVLSAYMAYSIADKPAFAPGFAAGYCAGMINGGF
mgnify:CR=1 FL=1